MARRNALARKTPDPGLPPLYDPAAHTDPDQMVFVELYCLCGAIWRQRDPVSHVEPFVRAWLGMHTGDGHGPASKRAAVAEREARREATFRAQGRADQYTPKEHPNLDVECGRDRPWPAFPDATVKD